MDGRLAALHRRGGSRRRRTGRPAPPRRRAPPLSPGERASTTTSSPRSRSRLTTRDPMNPVPPVTKAFTARDRIPRLEAVRAVPKRRSTRRAAQRAFTIGVAPGDLDLTELRELLRTAGVAVAGEMVQRRDRARSRPLLRPRQARRAEAGGEGGRRQPGRGRRRAAAAPGAQPRGGARRAGDRPHGDHPRHLRRPRALRRGQAPGGAGPARVQPRAHARAVDAPRAPRRRAHGRRHRHEGPGRVADRDRPPARARPHLGAASAACARPRPRARRCAASASAPGCRRSRWPATRTPASRRC